MPDLEVKTVEVTTAPLRSWSDGIRMIPTLRSGDETLSGLKLSQEQILSFIEKIKADQ